MTTRDNMPPPPDWQPEPRTSSIADHKCEGCTPKAEVEPLVWDGDCG